MSNFNIDLDAVPTQRMPEGKAGQGGWLCRACGTEIAVGEHIQKPDKVWVCDPCFVAHKWDAALRSFTRTATQAPPPSRNQYTPPPRPGMPPPKTGVPPPNGNPFSGTSGASSHGANRAANSTAGAWDDFEATKDKQAKKKAAIDDDSVEKVGDDNWVEIVFEIIPDSQIKKMFSVMSKAYHPDLSGGSEELQQRINIAYKKRKDEE